MDSQLVGGGGNDVRSDGVPVGFSMQSGLSMQLVRAEGTAPKHLGQAAGSTTSGSSGNGSGGVHSTAVAADAKMMLLPTPIRQQPSTPTATPLGTQSPSIGTLQWPPFPKSWNTKLEGSHSEMAFKRRKL